MASSPSTAGVAEELVQLCRAGRNLEAVGGIDAIRRKNESWSDTYEVNSAEVQGPFVGGDRFAVRYEFETTKATGRRMRMTEMALYTVKDGRIVRQEFYYHAPGA